ncbi:hypothetical protein [Nitrosomonas marina]|uniref:Uncharacterized protein n=1 Tax=Nitrosomonas marina TaxID=917 RepID=A0A1H8GJT6_9PROT|nr:hypothetical protein [Nitrosomonas marina]SEN44014.1 hypothetical protein SAMN05216325_11853 [Nitrosomonas marina]
MKNTDMRHYKTRKLDAQTIIAALAIIGMIAVTWSDHTNRSEIARAAQQEIVERDLCIEQLEYTILQIFHQPTHGDIEL